VNGQTCRTETSPTRHIVVLLLIQIKIEAEKAAIDCRSLTKINVSFYTDPKYSDPKYSMGLVFIRNSSMRANLLLLHPKLMFPWRYKMIKLQHLRSSLSFHSQHSPRNKVEKNGLGDIQLTAWASPKATTASGWVWGVGAVAQLDSATDDRLGSGAWGLGPTAVVLKSSGAWVFGGLINNIWSVSTDRDDVNQMLIQPFINYNFPEKPGRYLTFAPIITANWEADSGNVWTVPLGLGIGQVTKFGKQPVNMQASVYYNVKTPDFGAKWQLRLQLQLMFPK
jgi:hypothetical protein